MQVRLPVPSVVYDTYWKFACYRQDVFFKRLLDVGVISKDPIIANFKFTNAYRILDRVSQYLVKDVIYDRNFRYSNQDVIFRIILFKLFNKIETWEYIQKNVGHVSIANYDFVWWDQLLTSAKKEGRVLYSNAYMMASGAGGFKVNYKHSAHLRLLQLMIEDDFPSKVMECRSMKQVFDLLLSYPFIGKFLAYQYATDINYSETVDFSESEFTMPGPGAADGIRKCFSDYSGYGGSDLIRYMYDHQDVEFKRLDLNFRRIGDRELQLIDIQNLFCEFDKYCRVAHPEVSGISNRTRIKQKFKPNYNPIDFFFPPKWNVDIQDFYGY